MRNGRERGGRRVTTTQPFGPVSSRSPCSVCGHADGCLVADEDGMLAVICRNTESRRRCGSAGWLHLLVDKGPVWSSSRQRVLKAAKRIAEDFEK